MQEISLFPAGNYKYVGVVMTQEDQIKKLSEELFDLDGDAHYSKMSEICEIVLSAHAIRHSELGMILGEGLKAMARNAGCHETLGVLECMLDRMYDKSIIDSKKYEEVVRSSACGRWM